MTRVLLIGLDGCGFEAVRDNDFPVLKQKEFGAVTSENIPLKTPPIWSALITGEENTGVSDFPKDDKKDNFGKAKQHKKDMFEEFENPNSDDPCYGGIGGRREELKVDPWIEDYDYEVINFPIYNYSNKFNGIKDWQLYWGSKTLDGEISPKELIRKMSMETQNVFKKTLNKANEDNDITLTYVHDTDYICHICYMHHKLKKPVLVFWKLVEKQLKNVKDKLEGDPLVVFMSDHGSGIGNVPKVTQSGHSPLGFYSFNKDINVPNSIHITEFKDIIEPYLGD